MSHPLEHLATPSGLPRARSVPVPLEGAPGPLNAITDLDGFEVGYRTKIEGDHIRTGVTALLPRGRAGALVPCFAGFHSFNGNGELSGCHWIEESGRLEGPVLITNTHSCGLARDAVVRWLRDRFPDQKQATDVLPVVGETYDGELNDIDGFHVTLEDVLAALDGARPGAIELGSVGGGTGMIAYDFKGGSGSASRRVESEETAWTLGAFVQANFGVRRELTIAGRPVGRLLPGGEVRSRPAGSIIAVLATDAPLLPHQLKRLARRATLGIGRSGAIGHNGSGDIFLALSTANESAFAAGLQARPLQFLPEEALDAFFEAAVQAIEEAVLDAILANRPMTGRGITVRALGVEELRAVLE